jgi:hypothetical protein
VPITVDERLDLLQQASRGWLDLKRRLVAQSGSWVRAGSRRVVRP